MNRQSTLIILLFISFINLSAFGQYESSIFTPSDSFNIKRFNRSVVTGGSVYALGSAWLWTQWYSQYELGPFHFYNDMNSWGNMDKAGHLFSTYTESRIAYEFIRWTGVKKEKSIWTAFAVGSGVQLTFEIMDGFSTDWGFSIPDVAFNTLGAGLFATQAFAWDEQRIVVKSSNTFKAYPDFIVEGTDGSMTSIRDRATELYGSGPGARYLKDYNTMTIWLSANPASFISKSDHRVPEWLNLAVGYSSENLYGGFENAWPAEAPIYFLDEESFPRYNQYFLSLDVDFTRIKTNSGFLRTAFKVLNLFKFPAPSLEYNAVHGFRFIPMYW